MFTIIHYLQHLDVQDTTNKHQSSIFSFNSHSLNNVNYCFMLKAGIIEGLLEKWDKYHVTPNEFLSWIVKSKYEGNHLVNKGIINLEGIKIFPQLSSHWER